MSNTSTWDNKAFVGGAEQKAAPVRWAALFLIVALLLMLAACAIPSIQQFKTIPSLQQFKSMGEVSAEMEKLTQWILPLAATGACLGPLALLRLLLRFRRLQHESAERLKRGEQSWSAKSASLHSQIAGEHLAAERMQKENSALAERNNFLEVELEKRKLAERTLNEQRRELARSKDVLEMHVQERTQVIQKLQRRYELILNSAGEGICGLDVNGKATFVNPAAARMTGCEIKDLIGRSEQEMFGSTFLATDAAPDGNRLEDQTFRRPDGSSFLAELVKTPIHENGREVGAVLIFKDITERRKAEEALAQKAEELTRSNAELEQFAFVASHDLQEPLRKIQAFGDRLKMKCEKIHLGEAGDYLDRMQNAAARMQTLINDLLAFSRVIRSSQPFVPVNLTSVTKEVLGDLEVRIEKNGARVEIGELPTIDADPTQIRQLMQNLLSNALKFQPAGAQPVVKISSRVIYGPEWNNPPGGENGAVLTSNSFCEISVADNGIGFDEKHLEKIFAVFQRLHGRTEYEGTGVGLAVCRRIAERHSGSITARSQPGKGAIFVVTLPFNPIAN
jgi:PAS domain S-box-containing protein